MAKKKIVKKVAPPVRAVGRPEYRPDRKTRVVVERLVSGGMSHDDIALALEISDKTLQKYFRKELNTGAAKRRAEAINLIFTSARAGNVSAQRKLLSITGAEPVGEVREKKEPKRGKKEMDQIEADSVTGLYAPPSPPKLVVDNS